MRCCNDGNSIRFLTLRRSLQFIQLGLENRIAVLFVALCVSANVCSSQQVLSMVPAACFPTAHVLRSRFQGASYPQAMAVERLLAAQ